jgi:hypothetical protein
MSNMNIKQKIKCWITKDDAGNRTLHAEAELVEKVLEYSFVAEFREALAHEVATEYIKVNSEQLKKDILENPNFVSTVQNIIALKVVDKLTH